MTCRTDKSILLKLTEWINPLRRNSTRYLFISRLSLKSEKRGVLRQKEDQVGTSTPKIRLINHEFFMEIFTFRRFMFLLENLRSTNGKNKYNVKIKVWKRYYSGLTSTPGFCLSMILILTTYWVIRFIKTLFLRL